MALKPVLNRLLSDVLARDTRDAGRATAPMVAAADAVVIDTSDMSTEVAIEAAISVVEKRYHHEKA